MALLLFSGARAMPFLPMDRQGASHEHPPPCSEVFPEKDSGEVFLLTMTPGDQAFSLIGHSALWVRNPTRGVDRVYNFGTIDSRRQEPASALLLGTLQCEWETRTSERCAARYQRRGRSVVAQRLELPAGELGRLMGNVDRAAMDPDEFSEFHWLHNNCSTLVRDMLDDALGGALSRALSERAPLTPRQEILRHLAAQPPVWLAWNFLAGPRADEPYARYDALHIPTRLSEALAGVEYHGHPIAPGTCTLTEGVHPWAPPRTSDGDGLLWATGLGLAGLLAGLGLRSRRAAGGGILLLGVLTGSGGTLLAVLALTSRLEVYAWNENLFVAHPLSWLLAWPGWRLVQGRAAPAMAVHGARALAAAALLGLALQPLPWLRHDNLGMLGLLLPSLVVSAWLARR